jgi:hypothetical protein
MTVTLSQNPYTAGSWQYSQWNIENFYNQGDYDPVNNPGGMDNGGHSQNLFPMILDWLNFAAYIIQLCSMTTAAASQQTAWQEAMLANNTVAPVAFLTATEFAVNGLNFTPLFTANRALKLIQNNSGNAYVSSSIFDAVNNRTLVNINASKGVNVDSGLSQAYYGQDPANAPYASSMSGATASTAGTGGAVPAPGSGQENDFLAGDATYHDPIVDIQVWT